LASEYLMKKYQNVKPDEPKELTQKEKRQNWWYYHRKPLLIAVIVLAFVGSFVYEIVSQVKPDHQIAHYSQYMLPAGAEEALEARLSELATDVNGDGKVVVDVISFVYAPDDPNSYAVQVSMMGDISVGSSEFFLVEDPVAFQKEYGVLAMEDGMGYEDGMDAEKTVRYALEDLPALQDLELGRPLYLTKRYYVQEAHREEHTNMDLLWSAMTEGAK